ncbi:MAG: TRAP transporter large permease [Marinovum sp.]|jgi:C4-dicarboxylate transporter, DctM subunit|nr:TRAP transporter large permease [Marinovum sp.]MBT6507899.1 TRAP transporter large permease [Marinovum sp.]MBT6531930.1 TRAP transporter large permease [Marinovum sp.]MBT7906369.1 TRAP transporter large permease [Marinovum sp.]
MLTKTLAILIGLIALAVPIAATLGWLGLSLQYLESPMPLHRALGDIVWQTGTDFLLVAIPMFVLLGEILLRAGITERMYDGIVKWLGWLPGGLMHSNIGSSALFAATSGSSVATAATIGTVAIPQIKKRGYNEPLFLGTIAAGGTLGILIPPSINLILYGLLTETSVPELYLAGFLPGFLLAALFMGTVIVLCLLNPKWGGQKLNATWRERFVALPSLIPPLGIFIVVVGSIYAGLATPTEAASLGVVAAMALAAANGTLTLSMMRAAIEGTMRTTSMIMLIIVAAVFLNFVLSVIGLTQALADFVTGLGWAPMQTMIMIIVVLVLIGCFMETLSMLLTTAPLITPIVVALGFDPVWFGILLMVLLETALITPPIGINLYVVQGIRGRGEMLDVMKGAAPFVLTMFAMIVLLLIFPDIALWMPSLFY